VTRVEVIRRIEEQLSAIMDQILAGDRTLLDALDIAEDDIDRLMRDRRAALDEWRQSILDVVAIDALGSSWLGSSTLQ
jgi:hypothetical protein